MNSHQKIINLLTICRRAGKLIIGFDAVSDSIKNKKAFCVMTSSDISNNTLKEIRFICEKYNINLINLEIAKEELKLYLGKTVAVIGICDEGFARRFKELSEISG